MAKEQQYISTGIAIPRAIRAEMEAIAANREWKTSHIGRKFFVDMWADWLERNPALKAIVEAARAQAEASGGQAEPEKIESEI